MFRLATCSGGLSNFLYYVSLPTAKKDVVTTKRTRKDSYHNQLLEPTPCSVLLRIYGQTHGEHALETMLTESVVFTLLSERQLGPKLHGIFPGGRIEQYIPVSDQTRYESNPRLTFLPGALTDDRRTGQQPNLPADRRENERNPQLRYSRFQGAGMAVSHIKSMAQQRRHDYERRQEQQQQRRRRRRSRPAEEAQQS